MQSQTLFFDLYRAGLRTMTDVTRISLEHGARLQSRQLELLMAMQIRLAESQAERVMDFWTRCLTLPAGPAARGGPSPTSRSPTVRRP
jgi:hypothetical protein